MGLKYLILLATCGTLAAGEYHPTENRIVGGSLTTVNQYPFAAVILDSWDTVNFRQNCGGTVLTNTAILSAAHCFEHNQPARTRIRVGSSFAHSGGTVHNVRLIINHHNYNSWTFDNDISVLRTQTFINYIGSTVAPASIAGSNYNLADNQAVWAIGWGMTSNGGPTSEQLRHVQIWTINQAICRARYGTIITDNMLCSGWLDVGGRDQCSMDSGGPLIHNNAIVGVCSFGNGCGHSYYPGVNARVSRFTPWIQQMAA